jgi:four helix bundle protein
MENPNDFNFKDLNVWQRAVEFAKIVIDTVENNSSERKHFRLLEQVESSATSVALNIAEGKGRHSKKECTIFIYRQRFTVRNSYYAQYFSS